MPELGAIARPWLSPAPASPWRFDDAGDALVWRDGATVAFRAEVEESLRRVAVGLEVVPPFPAVAVLLAAARGEERRISAEHWELVRDAMEAAAPWLFARVAVAKEVAETAAALRMLEHVDDAVFSRPDALPFLVEAVFEGAELPRDPAGAAEFLRDLGSEPTPGSATPSEEEARRQAAEWGEGLAALRRGLARLDPAALARRVRTGLDRDVLPADVAWPDGAHVRGLLAVLRGDPDLGAVARLATDAMAAVRLPRPGSMPEELPIGGYADLANRGSPERLLVSELAHDDLTLAVRVALREALYLRREAPPRAPHGTRCLLLDSGIRLWGVGRVFATAVGLALAATPERGVSVRAWRACGRSIERIDLGTREGIEAHLEALRPEPHPAAALRPFLAECSAMGGQVECCVVLHPRALEERDVRDALRGAGRVVHVVTVAADGELAVHAFNAHGSQVLRTATLDLGSLLAPEPRRSGGFASLSLHDAARDDADLPAILRLDRLPLRIPSPPWGGFREAAGRGLLERTDDRRLVLWTDPDLGPVELADHTPPGALRDFRVTGAVAHLVTAGGHRVPTSWMQVDLTQHVVDTRLLPSIGRTPSDAVVFGDSGEMVGLVSGRRVHVVHVDEPDVAMELPLPPGARHERDRLFHRASTGEWWMLVGDGGLARFEPLAFDAGAEVVTCFERSGDGPWALLARPLRAQSLATREVTPLPVPDVEPKPYAISSSGRRIVFTSRVGGVHVTVDLGDGSVHLRPPNVECTFVRVPAPNLRRQFGKDARIGRTPRGELVLDGQALRRTMDGRVRFETAGAGDVGAPQSFGPRTRLQGRSWRLRTARWRDGSRAILDSRGMVHLVSSDRAVPEVTLVLRDGLSGGWSSDGVAHGSRYFLGDAPSASADEFISKVARFTERLR